MPNPRPSDPDAGRPDRACVRAGQGAPALRGLCPMRGAPDGRGRPCLAAQRRSELIGRPLGGEAFLDAISRRLNRVVTPRKRGRKLKGDVAAAEGEAKG
jgi:hypothetical protein